MNKEVEVRFPGGYKFKLPTSYQVEGLQSINKSYNGFVNYFFGLRKSRTNIKSTMIRLLKNELRSSGGEGSIDDDAEFADYQAYDIARLPVRTNVDRYNYDHVIEFKNSRNITNYRFGVYEYNTKGMWLFKQKLALDLIKRELSKPADPESTEQASGLTKIMDAVLKIAQDPKVTIETLNVDGLYTEDEVKEIQTILAPGIDFLIAVLNTKTMNDQVLLSSFLALSK